MVSKSPYSNWFQVVPINSKSFQLTAVVSSFWNLLIDFESISYNRIISLILKQKLQDLSQRLSFTCTPAEARTLDTLIKSQVLYRLSYGCIIFRFKSALLLNCGCKGTTIFWNHQTFLRFSFKKHQIRLNITCIYESFDVFIPSFHHSVVNIANPNMVGCNECQTDYT